MSSARMTITLGRAPSAARAPQAATITTTTTKGKTKRRCSITPRVHRPQTAGYRLPATGYFPHILPRIRLRNNLAHALLIESFEPFISLQVLQMRTDRAVGTELRGLFRRDQPVLEQRRDSLLLH